MAAASDNASASGQSRQTILHASCVAIDGRGLLILGASGSGKSGLALDLMALGCELVSDDRVILTRVENSLVASAPEPIVGLIEARGIGLLNARPHGPVAVACVVDLDQTETGRLPPPREKMLLGQSVTLLLKVETRHFPSALVQYCKQGRQPELCPTKRQTEN
jgi:HPr kinase/phosphorylase